MMMNNANAQKTILIVGNTYPVKERIKELGGRWDAGAKGWRVPEENVAEVEALVQAAPLSCRRCKTTGKRGESPFTTLPDAGLCDDCI